MRIEVSLSNATPKIGNMQHRVRTAEDGCKRVGQEVFAQRARGVVEILALRAQEGTLLSWCLPEIPQVSCRSTGRGVS